MVPLGHLRSLPMLLRQLERGLEEVYEQPRSPVEARQHLSRGNALEPPITQQLAHDGAVLLFDPGLVILAIRPRAGKLDAIAQAVLDHRFIDKFAAVIDIQRSEGERQADTDALKYLYQQRAFAYDQRSAFCPAACDIGQHKAMHIAAPSHLSAVRDKIHFHAARGRIIPVGKGSNGHATADLRHYSARLL